jgi:hypothetical protein
MQRASIFRDPCAFPGLRASTDMAGPGVSAAVEHFSRPAAPVRISTTPAIPRTPAGDPGRPTALRPAPNCPRQSQSGDNASRTANSAMVLAPKPKACYAARSIPPRPPSPVPSRNPDLDASHVIPPSRTSPATQQRLVTRRIVGPRQNDPPGRHRWPSTEPPLPYIAATSAELDSALAAEREAGWRTGQPNLPTATPAMATSARHRGDSSTRSRRKHLMR